VNKKYEIGTRLNHVLDGRSLVVVGVIATTAGKVTTYRTTVRYVNQVSGRYEIADVVEGEAFESRLNA
jgi:hypothetical protein